MAKLIRDCLREKIAREQYEARKSKNKNRNLASMSIPIESEYQNLQIKLDFLKQEKKKRAVFLLNENMAMA